jgi:hypothetical protein
MKLKSILISTALCLLFFSCSVDKIIGVSDEITTKHIYVSNFTRLEVSDDFNAYIIFSDTEESVKIEANENLHRHIIIENDGGRLNIRFKNNLNVIGRETLNVFITTKRINDFRANGDSKITLNNLLTDSSIKIRVTGDSYFYGEIDANNLELIVLGDSKADLYGYAKNLDADLAGDSSLIDYDLTVENLKIKLSGDSDAYLTATESIEIDASGDSSLHYKGGAIITYQHLTGDSKIVKL